MDSEKKSKIEYDEKQKKIYLYEDSIYDEDHKIEGEVYFNHDEKEIRIYNFSKSELTDEEKSMIMFCILEKEYLFPYIINSTEIVKGNIAEYTLLINGYLLNGEYKERGKKYKTIVEELIDNFKVCDDDNDIYKLLCKIRHFYKKYDEDIGKKEVNIYLTVNGVINGFIEYINFARIFAAYSKSKGKKFRLITSHKFWEKEKKIIILPY